MSKSIPLHSGVEDFTKEGFEFRNVNSEFTFLLERAAQGEVTLYTVVDTEQKRVHGGGKAVQGGSGVS